MFITLGQSCWWVQFVTDISVSWNGSSWSTFRPMLSKVNHRKDGYHGPSRKIVDRRFSQAYAPRCKPSGKQNTNFSTYMLLATR